MVIVTVFILFIVLSFFFSGIETGFITVDRLKIEKEAKTNHSKKELLDFLNQTDRFLGTTLIGNNISNVIISSLFTVYILDKIPWLNEKTGPLFIAVLVLIFGEVIPKALFRDAADRLIPFCYPIIQFFMRLFQPAVKLVVYVNNALAKHFGLSLKAGYQSLTKEDLSYLLQETRDDENLIPAQREMLEEALEFKELEAKNVMIPRTEMVAIKDDMSVPEIIALAKKEGYTRYPVYRDNLDNIIGILIIYDLLQKQDEHSLTAASLVREAYFAPETMDLSSLFSEMQKRKKSIAIVVDSYGGTAGMVSAEDIIEEIVGDIEDEYDFEDVESDDIERINENTLIVKGYVDVDYLNDEYGLNLPEGDYETVAGLIIDNLAKIPPRGKVIELGNWYLEVLTVTNRKIVKVKIAKKEQK